MNTPQGAAILEHPVGDLGQTLGEDDRLNGKPRKGVDGQGGQGGWDGQPLEGGQAAKSMALRRGNVLSDDHIGDVHALPHVGDAHHRKAIVFSRNENLGVGTGAEPHNRVARSVLGQLKCKPLTFGHIGTTALTMSVHKIVDAANLNIGLVVGIDKGFPLDISVFFTTKGAGSHKKGKQKEQ